ncbi:MAG: STAS domain-containing protein [Candidatus Sulfotelmatobacter sp.]
MTTARHVSVKQLPEKLSIKQGRSFFREVEPHLQADRPRVVLDCSKVRQLDSAGIHVLLRVLEEAMKRNGDVKLASIPPAAAAILELTRVGRLFEAFDNTADAVNSFHQFPIMPVPHAFGHVSSPLTPRVRTHSFEAAQSDSHASSPGSEETINTPGRWLTRQIAGCLVLLLLLVAPLAAAAQQQTSSSRQTDVPAAQSQSQAQSQDSNTGAQKSNYEPFQPQALPDSPGTVRSQAADGNQLSTASQPSPIQQQDVPQEPVGTAAAEFIKTTGVAASKPAGSAIAPAKQRRARSILIKVAAIAGAGVAVGVVVALSAASPSRPVGSH